MTAPARFTKADLRRAVSAVAAAGVSIAEIRIHPNGEIRILPGQPIRKHDNDEWADLE